VKVKELIEPNDFDRKAKSKVKLKGIYDKKNLNIGASKTVSAQTVEVKSTGDGQVYGRRTIYQK
jgi:hypothetical protein